MKENKISSLAEATAVVKRIAAKKSQDATDREVLARVEKALTEIAKQRDNDGERHGEFDTKDAERMEQEARREAKMGGAHVTKALELVSKMPTGVDHDIDDAQEFLDNSYLLSVALKRPVGELEYFKRGLQHNKYFKKTLNVADVGNAGVGGTLTGWQPAVFTSNMIEKIRLALTIANQHERITMPADPYRWPLEGPDATIYTVSERGDADDDVLGTPAGVRRVPAGFTQTGADHLIMSSKKIGTRSVFSAELEEDSFIPILPYITEKIVRAMAEAQDNLVVNGHAGVTLDSGYTYTGGAILSAWDGYRWFLEKNNAPKVSAGGALTIDISHLRMVRQKMGKYALRPSDVRWIVGPVGYIKLLSLAAGAHESPVQTIDKYGSAATIVTGEVARVDGVPVIVTEFMGPAGGELLNASGIYNGTTTTFTEALLVRPSAFIFGDRRAASLTRQYIPVTDQLQLITLQRLTFMNKYPNETMVGGVYNILKG